MGTILKFGHFKGQKLSDTPQWYQDWLLSHEWSNNDDTSGYNYDSFIKDEKGNPITYWGGLEETKQERMYSEKEVLDILFSMSVDNPNDITEWFEKFKKK